VESRGWGLCKDSGYDTTTVASGIIALAILGVAIGASPVLRSRTYFSEEGNLDALRWFLAAFDRCIKDLFIV